MQKKIIPLIVASALSAVHLQTASAADNNRPNILFCIADDAGHMSAYGTPWLQTPAFDYIAKHGILFMNMYTCNAKSAPSRATMITGRNSWQLEEACNHWPKFPTKFKSYPEALLSHGYEVGYTGKGWGPGIAKNEDGSNRELTGKQWKKKKLVPATKGISSIDYAGNFKDFMDNRDTTKPFCFWYGALEPHRGYEFGSSKRFGKKTSDIDKVPDYWPDNENVRRDMLDYAVEVEHYDNHLGQILKTLEESGEMDNTIIIAISDHNMPFPRCKGQEYYNSNHIPMAIMWTKGIANPGTTVNEYLSSIDLAPTILEACQVTEEESGMQPITGRSFLDILKGENTGIDRNYVMIGKERHDVGRPNDEGYPIRGLIRGDFLYLRNFETDRWPAGNPSTGYMNVDGGPTKTEVLKTRKDPKNAFMWQLSFGKRGSYELYNIRKDPYCMENLSGRAEYRVVEQRMEKEMFKRLQEQEDPRVFGKGDIFDRYPDTSDAHDFWKRTHQGEKVGFGWIKASDFENDLE